MSCHHYVVVLWSQWQCSGDDERRAEGWRRLAGEITMSSSLWFFGSGAPPACFCFWLHKKYPLDAIMTNWVQMTSQIDILKSAIDFKWRTVFEIAITPFPWLRESWTEVSAYSARGAEKLIYLNYWTQISSIYIQIWYYWIFVDMWSYEEHCWCWQMLTIVLSLFPIKSLMAMASGYRLSTLYHQITSANVWRPWLLWVTLPIDLCRRGD